MTGEEYEKEYLNHVRALGMALSEEMKLAPIDKMVKQGLLPVHIGVQVAVSEINALVSLLVNLELVSHEDYREAVLKQLTFQKEIVLDRLAKLTPKNPS